MKTTLTPKTLLGISGEKPGRSTSLAEPLAAVNPKSMGMDGDTSSHGLRMVWLKQSTRGDLAWDRPTPQANKVIYSRCDKQPTPSLTAWCCQPVQPYLGPEGCAEFRAFRTMSLSSTPLSN